MMLNAWLLALAGVLLAAGVVAVSLYISTRPTVLRFAVPAGYPDDVRLVQLIGQQFTRERAAIRLRPVTADGPLQSAAMIDADQADLAIVRADLALPKHGQAVAILRQNIVVLIVPAPGSPALGPATAVRRGKAARPKPITKIEDLAGRRIGVVGRGEFNAQVLHMVLRQYDIAADKVTVVPLNPDDVGAAVRRTPVDVIFALGPETSRFIADAITAASSAKAKPTFLPIGASEAIANRQAAYESTEIKEGVFGGAKPLPADTVETIAFNHYIVARKSVSDTKIADFTRLLFGVRQSLAREVPAIAKIEKPDTDKDAAVQSHPGAAAYLDDEQKTFFDRYSDLLYWGLMLMSFVGSAVAWVASYARAEDRVRRMKVIERLLAAVKAARAARTIEEVEKLRIEVDDILHRTLHQVEQDELDQASLTAFSLALDQAQLAINDRRAALIAQDAGDDESEPSPPKPSAADVTPLRVATT